MRANRDDLVEIRDLLVKMEEPRRGRLLRTADLAGLSLPVIGVGIWLGGRHFLHTDPQDFRRFAILLLAFLAVLGLAKSVL